MKVGNRWRKLKRTGDRVTEVLELRRERMKNLASQKFTRPCKCSPLIYTGRVNVHARAVYFEDLERLSILLLLFTRPCKWHPIIYTGHVNVSAVLKWFCFLIMETISFVGG